MFGCMPTSHAFSARLWRLIQARSLDSSALAEQAEVARAEIGSVLSGRDEPSSDLLRRLAPALGLHRSDMFVIAGQPVPDDLAPHDPDAFGVIDSLAWSLTYLPHAVPQLNELARAMPQQPRLSGPRSPIRGNRQYPEGSGGLIVGLQQNRNLAWLGAAQFLLGLGGGPMLSASTIGLIGGGRKALTPELLAGFAAALDIPTMDIGALADIDLTTVTVPTHPDAAQAADLIWESRRLTAGQIRLLRSAADAIRREGAADRPGTLAGPPYFNLWVQAPTRANKSANGTTRDG